MSDATQRSSGFARNSALNLVQQGWSVIIGITTSVLLARGLGTEDRGAFAIILLLSSLIMVFFNAGLEPALVYFAAKANNNFIDIARASIALTTWVVVIALLLTFMIIALAHGIFFPNTDTNLLLLSLFLIPVTLYSNNLLILFRGIEDFKSFNLIEGISQPLNTLLVFVFVWILRWGVGGAVAALFLRYCFSFFVTFIRLRPYLDGHSIFALKISHDHLQAIFSYGLKVYGYYIVLFLNQRVDVFILSALAVSKTSIALYDLAFMLGEKLWLLSRSVSITIFSRIAALENHDEERNRLTQIVVRHIFWFSVIVGLGFAILAQPAIRLLYGDEYLDAAIALKLILPGLVLLGAGHVISNDLAARGMPGQIAIESTIGIIINTILNLFLIPRLDIQGAAIASSISYSVMTLLFVFTFCKVTNTRIVNLFFLQYEDVRLWRSAFRIVRSKLIRMRITRR